MAEMKSLTDFMDSAFWTRPEGRIAKLFLGALGVGVAVGAFFMLPAFLALLQTIVTSLLTLAVTGAILFAIVALIMNDSFRNTVGYMFRAGIRWISDYIVDLSPIAVLKDYIKELKKSLQKIDVQITNLNKQIQGLKQLISKNEKEKENSIGLAGQAKKQGKEHARILEGRKAVRLSKSNMTLQQLLAKMEMVYRVLVKMREVCDFSIQNTESEVDITIREHTALNSGQMAMQEAMRITKGDPQKKAMFDQAVEVIAVRTAGALGEIDEGMRVSQTFFDSVDLQNGVFDEKALRMLEEWEQRDASGILGPGGKRALIADAYSEIVPYDQRVSVASREQTLSAPADMSDYFKN